MRGGRSRMRFVQFCTVGLTIVGIAVRLSAGASEDAGVVSVLSGLKSPQAIVTDPQSAPFIALADGWITQLVARETAVPLVETGGRPAGLAFDATDNLYAADAQRKVILRITPWGDMTVLADRYHGEAFRAPRGVAAANSLKTAGGAPLQHTGIESQSARPVLFRLLATAEVPGRGDSTIEQSTMNVPISKQSRLRLPQRPALAHAPGPHYGSVRLAGE